MAFFSIPSKNLTLVCVWAQVSTWIRGIKIVLFLMKRSGFGEDLFFGLHLICSPEKNRGWGSFTPMLKIGRNWGKIANYPPQCLTNICTPECCIKLLNEAHTYFNANSYNKNNWFVLKKNCFLEMHLLYHFTTATPVWITFIILLEISSKR